MDNSALSHLTRDTEKLMTLLFILAVINIWFAVFYRVDRSRPYLEFAKRLEISVH